MSDPKQEITSQQITPERIMGFAFAFAAPLMIEAAIRNRVFDTLETGAKTIEQVSSETGASVRGLRILMNGLIALELLAKDETERYSLTPESSVFLVSTKPSFQGGIFRHASSQLIPKWLDINEIVRIGKPARVMNEETEGAKFFQEFVEDIFPMSYAGARVLAGALGVSNTEREVKVLDIAAGSGVWSIALAEASPRVTVTVVDWVEVIPVTRRITARHNVSDRYRFIEGNIRTTDFGDGYDIATLGHILHSEGEERSRQLIRKTFDALAPGGTIVIAEMVTNEDRTGPPFSLIFAVNMLVNTEHGDTFSFGEMRAWLEEAGFEDARMLDAPGPSPLILATKPKS
jgi:ubiquinone/menaquinone biosynthesis C-methylase UbiE